jgi:ABC-type sugar transport system permease subunit
MGADSNIVLKESSRKEISIKQSKWKEIKRNKVAYVYISPFFILFAIFGLFPIAAGLYISFFRWDGMSAMHYVGIRNYYRLLHDSLFWKSLYNNFFIGIIAHIPILLGGLALAFILNSKLVKYVNVFKTLYFMPMVTSAVAVSIVFQNMFGYNFGLINYVLKSLGLHSIDWFGGSGKYINIAIIIMFAWKWVGWNMVIYLAGMQGISHDILEAAIVDGASQFKIFTRITIPLLKPIIVFTIIQSTIGTINLFTEPFVLTNSLLGGSNNNGMTVMMYLLNKAPQGNNLYGYASACAYILTFIIVIVSAFTFGASGREGYKERRRKERTV